jgi:hypothetical protein
LQAGNQWFDGPRVAETAKSLDNLSDFIKK